MSSVTPLPNVASNCDDRFFTPTDNLSAIVLYDEIGAGLRGLEALRSFLRESDQFLADEPATWRIGSLRKATTRSDLEAAFPGAAIVVISTSTRSWRSTAVDALLKPLLEQPRSRPVSLLIADADASWWVVLDQTSSSVLPMPIAAEDAPREQVA